MPPSLKTLRICRIGATCSTRPHLVRTPWLRNFSQAVTENGVPAVKPDNEPQQQMKTKNYYEYQSSRGDALQPEHTWYRCIKILDLDPRQVLSLSPLEPSTHRRQSIIHEQGFAVVFAHDRWLLGREARYSCAPMNSNGQQHNLRRRTDRAAEISPIWIGRAHRQNSQKKWPLGVPHPVP